MYELLLISVLYTYCFYPFCFIFMIVYYFQIILGIHLNERSYTLTESSVWYGVSNAREGGIRDV